METAAEAVPFVPASKVGVGGLGGWGVCGWGRGAQKPKRPRKPTFDAQGRGSRGCGSAPRTALTERLRARRSETRTQTNVSCNFYMIGVAMQARQSWFRL